MKNEIIITEATEDEKEKTIISFDYIFDIENNIYNVSVGNLNIKIFSDYSIRYFDGNNYKLYRINEHNFEKSLSIIVFDKDSNYDDGESIYTSKLCRNIEKYINQVENMSWDEIYRINNINNIRMFDNLILEQNEPSAMFSRNLIFFDDIYCYIIQIWYGNQHIKMPIEMPEYFNQDNFGNYWWNDNIADLSKLFKEFGLLPEYLTKLLNKTNYILETIELF